MQTLFERVYDYDNLVSAFQKARKGKTLKLYVLEFEDDVRANLVTLQNELVAQTYRPQPLKTFILRDPKTRKISKSDFRDRIVHHAICNVIEPIFDKHFIFDSYANRLGKGTLKAIERFDVFKRKASRNNTRTCFVLKADIRHYFETVDHEMLLSFLKKSIGDERLLQLITIILQNYLSSIPNKGMPLGNLTSQFFANVYLNELDQFVKHDLKAVYYIRYVDDFVILHESKSVLDDYMKEIDDFLKKRLCLQLHPDKSKIITLHRGVTFLGFRIFYHHKLIRKKNLRKFEKRLESMKEQYDCGLMSEDDVIDSFEGWLAYVSHADTYKYRRHLIQKINKNFQGMLSSCETKPQQSFKEKSEASALPLSSHKTLFLLQKGLPVNQIAQERRVKEGTIWEHLAQLIEHGQYSVWRAIPKKKILTILTQIKDSTDTLTDIKQRVGNNATFDEIACVLAYLKCKNKRAHKNSPLYP